MRQYLVPMVLGAGAGAFVTIVAWQFISKMLDKQFETGAQHLLAEVAPGLRREIQTTIEREVPPKVRTEMTRTLQSFGLTPATGQQIARVLDGASRMGII